MLERMQHPKPRRRTASGDEIKVVIYGCRGSIPVSGPGYEKYGGSTSCLLVTSDNAVNIGIIDAGTGIRTLGRHIMQDEALREKPIVIAFTHFHWDHIQGLPFFEPAYVKGRKISMLALGRDRPIDDLQRVFSVPMQQEYFPVQLCDMGANFEFLMPDEDIRFFPRAVVTAHKHPHPGSAYGYRISGGGKSIVICTDVEHGTDLDPDVIDFCRGADLLLHDAQYTPEELSTHRGWGHSSYRQAIDCAKLAGVKKLVLTHHDPDHDDAVLAEIERHSQQLFPNCVLARDNMTLVV
ncbi:MAG TPA: MBL fold metallo-hydrolase [Terrimicrobiaceae bacterium]|nr:MBL fold metallo-hydrolase [Terrimicrobiaceae bacterium]